MSRLSTNLLRASVLFLSASVSTVYAETMEFLSMSDIHIKSINTKMVINPKDSDGKNNLDKPTFRKMMSLLQNEAHSTLKNARFVLVTGDIGGHAANQTNRNNYVKTGFQELYMELDAALKWPVFFIFGNNDSPLGHYAPYSSELVNIALQAQWVDPYLSSGTHCNDLAQTNPCMLEKNTDTESGGNYTAKIAPNLKLIGINSIPFLKQATSHKGDKAALDWLAKALDETADGDNVLLAMHVGPSGWDNKPQDYRAQFEAILARHPGKVVGIMVGHTHLGNIAAYELSSSKQNQIIPIITTNGLSTDHGNAPAFNHIIMDRKDSKSPWQIKNFSTWSWLQKSTNDNLVLKKYYEFNGTFCANKSVANLPDCLKANMQNGSFTKSFKEGVAAKRTAGNPNFKVPAGSGTSQVWVKKLT